MLQSIGATFQRDLRFIPGVAMDNRAGDASQGARRAAARERRIEVKHHSELQVLELHYGHLIDTPSRVAFVSQGELT